MSRELADPPRDEDCVCHVSIVPVRVKSYDSTVSVMILRTVGYRAVGSCGWRGSARSTWAEARADRAEHLAD